MKTIIGIMLIILCFTFNYSFADSKSASIKIVVLGSSTAAGTGPSHPDSAWVNRFRNYVQSNWENSDVINLAVGGYVTYQILPHGFAPPQSRPNPEPEHNITKALSYNPTAIIINLPSNDASQNYSIQEQLANYDTVLALAHSMGVPVWVATTQPRNLSLEGRRSLKEMRDSTFTRFEHPIDFWTGLAEEDGNIKLQYNSGDNVHLNDAAHKILFERVVKARAGLRNAKPKKATGVGIKNLK